MSAMYLGSMPGSPSYEPAVRGPGAVHRRLAMLTLGLYALVVGVGYIVRANEPFISLSFIWLGPLSPLVAAWAAIKQGLYLEALVGFATIGPACLWAAAMQWSSAVWLERVAATSIVLLYLLLLLFLGMSA